MGKGQRNIQHTAEQKAALVERVCQLYESQHATIASCCEAAGVEERTFRTWLAANSEFSERYKKAKELQDVAYWQEIIRPLAKTAVQRHLEAELLEDESDVFYQGAACKGDDGERLRQRTTKKVLPNPTVTIFALKGLYPGMFADKHEHSGPNGGPVKLDLDTSAMSTEEKRQLLKLLEQATKA